MTNSGKTTATNITLLEYLVKTIMPCGESDAEASAQELVNSLSPSQTFIIKRKITLSYGETDMAKKVMTEWAETHVYMLVDICLKYTDVSSEHEYKVSAQYELDNQETTIKYYKDE